MFSENNHINSGVKNAVFLHERTPVYYETKNNSLLITFVCY